MLSEPAIGLHYPTACVVLYAEASAVADGRVARGGDYWRRPGAIQISDTIICEGMADVLHSWKGAPKASIDPAKLYSSTAPRLDYQDSRPVTCGAHPAVSKEPDK